MTVTLTLVLGVQGLIVGRMSYKLPTVCDGVVDGWYW